MQIKNKNSNNKKEKKKKSHLGTKFTPKSYSSMFMNSQTSSLSSSLIEQVSLSHAMSPSEATLNFSPAPRTVPPSLITPPLPQPSPTPSLPPGQPGTGSPVRIIQQNQSPNQNIHLWVLLCDQVRSSRALCSQR